MASPRSLNGRHPGPAVDVTLLCDAGHLQKNDSVVVVRGKARPAQTEDQGRGSLTGTIRTPVYR